MKRGGFLKRRTKLSKKRKKRSSKEILRDRAWATFSKWIRNRDPLCVSCLAELKQIPSANAGHYWHAVLDFDEININGQCVQCNKWRHGNLSAYSSYLINKHGIRAYRALESRHYLAMAGEYRTEQDFLDIIEKYDTLVNR